MERVLRGEFLSDEDIIAWWCSIEFDLLQAGVSHEAIRQAEKFQVYYWYAKLLLQGEQQASQPKPQVIGIPVVVGRH